MFIAIKKPIVSQNVRDKWHWAKRSAERIEWEKEIWAALNGQVKKHKAKGKRRLKITSIRPRMLDFLNLCGGSKGLVDAIVNLGLLIDDSPNYVDVEIKQIDGPTGTIIELEEI